MAKINLNDPKNRVNLVWTTDWHFSEIPPGRRADDYRNALLDKLTFVRGLVEKVNGVAICGGDVFHHKKPHHQGNSFRLIIDLIHALSKFPHGCVFGSVGNHDLSFDRMDSLPKQPLGLLIAVGAYHDLNREPMFFTNADESVKVSVETFPFAEGDETIQNILNAGPRQPGVNFRVGVVHAYGHTGEGGSFYGQTRTIGYNELKGADFDILLWGHDHSRHGVDEVDGITHVNLGSMARAAFTYDEVDRDVVAAILSFGTDGIRYKEVPIPVKPLEIAFAAADKSVEQVGKSEEITSFFAEMDEAVQGIEVNDPVEIIKELCKDDLKLENLCLELCYE